MTRRTIVRGLRRPPVMPQHPNRRDSWQRSPRPRRRSSRRSQAIRARGIDRSRTMGPHSISATRPGGMSCRYPVIRRAVELWRVRRSNRGKDAFFQEQLGEGFGARRRYRRTRSSPVPRTSRFVSHQMVATVRPHEHTWLNKSITGSTTGRELPPDADIARVEAGDRSRSRLGNVSRKTESYLIATTSCCGAGSIPLSCANALTVVRCHRFDRFEVSAALRTAPGGREWFRATFGLAFQPPIVGLTFQPFLSSVDLSVRS